MSVVSDPARGPIPQVRSANDECLTPIALDWMMILGV